VAPGHREKNRVLHLYGLMDGTCEVESGDPEVVRRSCWTTPAHLSTKRDARVGDWVAANNVELAYTPTSASYLNHIEGHFAALRYFTLDGTDHASHTEQAA
jgi:hypothetical protein